VINKVYRVIVKKKKKKKTNTQENGKKSRTDFQKPDSVVYLNSGTNLLGGLRKNQSLSILIDSVGAPVCTSSPKIGILKETEA
jgi:trafficking kinesin-binding protein 2